jgi:hypothetical protein
MGCCNTFGKNALRIGTIVALAGGATALIAGPERVGAVFQQAKTTVNAAIDQNVEDPIAMRAQLRDLEGQYPERIAMVREDLAELETQVAQLSRELTTRFSSILQRQEAELQSLANMEQTKSYEEIAEYMVDTTGQADHGVGNGLSSQSFVVQPEVIEVGPEGAPKALTGAAAPITVSPEG